MEPPKNDKNKAMHFPITSELEEIILEGQLESRLPDDYYTVLHSQQIHRKLVLDDLAVRQNKRFWLTLGSMGPISLFLLGVWPAWGYHPWPIIGCIVASLIVAGMATGVEEAEETSFPYAEFEDLIKKTLEGLNSEGAVLIRARNAGFIKQVWIDNMRYARKIQNDIASTTSYINHCAQQAADKRSKGESDAFAQGNLARSQAELQTLNTEWLRISNYTFPNISKCNSLFKIDRNGKMKWDNSLGS